MTQAVYCQGLSKAPAEVLVWYHLCRTLSQSLMIHVNVIFLRIIVDVNRNL